MNTYLLIAGILSILLGLVHTGLGEYLMFRHMRKPGSIVPSISHDSKLKKRHLGIIWATWHLVSIFGIGIGIILIETAWIDKTYFDFHMETNVLAVTMAVSSLLVIIGTKGKHPGWVVLLLISILLLISK